ncbi:hypothetical protein Poly24_16540 [Rosistilla carotiformis]|uniref:FlgN protein n=1 Tax=Rosistilla carotiformis TaxID=2528017 RepID=A0A518JQY5_9BACT|nr:hypothetical protein [Rosistilla carotiformis]QDV67948.1 hypothetical protein Poly24_16540 [Rosistilla carotiformis]
MLNWMADVDTYLQQLNETSEALAGTLVGLEQATRKAASEEIHNQCAKLGSLLRVLQQQLAQREALLIEFPDAADAAPVSLQAALSTVKHSGAVEMVKRCAVISTELQGLHQKAIALFVGQYHLSNMTEEFLRLMSGVSAKPITYDKTDDEAGGSFLDRAA